MTEDTTGQRRRLPLLLLVLIAGLLYVWGQYVGSRADEESESSTKGREITVEGESEVIAAPDVARITLSVQTGAQPSSKAALDILTQRFTAVANAVESLSIKKEDIKTVHLGLSPVYDYPGGRQTLRGWEASQSVEITIRDLDSIGSLLQRTTQEGVNQAGNIVLTIDDPQKLQQQAEALAIADAREKAEVLSKALGVRLGDVKTFSTSPAPALPTPVYARAELEATTEDTALPVPVGTNKITATVTITYELR